MKVAKKTTMNFSSLVRTIQQIHDELSTQAGRAVNISLTLRNWMIGFQIAVFELKGSDRAKYGEGLLSALAEQLIALKISNCNRRQLYDYLAFYRAYPQMAGKLPAKLRSFLSEGVLRPIGKVPTPSAQSIRRSALLLKSLSYSMFKLLAELDDDTKRRFYETECLQGNWSVRELKRQIDSLYFERSRLSVNKKKLTALSRSDAEKGPRIPIRDPYVFEFLGLKPHEVMSESVLEDQLLNKLQTFLLELGQGFCFEARQKRILIGDAYHFIDLVFYHRVLKCHVLVDLKLADFNHENIGQLNTYVSWYKKNMMVQGDNLPIGILLCTRKDQALAEYDLAGIGNSLFVSQYQLHLPTREELQKVLERERALVLREQAVKYGCGESEMEEFTAEGAEERRGKIEDCKIHKIHKIADL